MRYIIILSFIGLVLTDNCPQDKQISCITDVNHALDLCDKAAKDKGKDQSADINCIKYLASVEQDCWPCICQIAKDNGYKVKGCNNINRIKS